jgi:7,8-dihydropterin-6-yl-methyl-4-(beta-D-ribofuranosyl)aminobenzene 5'-phosphate synthase
MGDSIVEESLALDTPQGLIVVTGCAHPGIVDIVRRSMELVPGEIHLVMGGFHLGRLPREDVLDIIEEFKSMGVKKVAPTHCTGDMAIRLFREAYGEDFIEAGCGAVIEI